MAVEHQPADLQDRERRPARLSGIAFALGLISLVGALYALAGFTAWNVWRALIAL